MIVISITIPRYAVRRTPVGYRYGCFHRALDSPPSLWRLTGRTRSVIGIPCVRTSP
jgi:hypothetical protein